MAIRIDDAVVMDDVVRGDEISLELVGVSLVSRLRDAGIDICNKYFKQRTVYTEGVCAYLL